MNKTLFLSLAVTSLAAVAMLFAAPAQAQNAQNLPATGYCTGETIQISGWERDLVRKNKGLEKFHWSAINTVNHYRVVPAGAGQKTAARPLTPYHNVKPQVISNWSNPKGPVTPDKTYIASADNGTRTNTSAQLRRYGNNTSTYAHMNRNEGSSYSYASYGGERSSESNVSGRVMHY
ncbi:MAG: hypothetical protein JSS83_10990 [Cyanobacteria bacterium SZAS LIN-3]|nr:hypothetical protein [Cyanobacteria bacterium SZAS LIN-3]